MWTSIMDETAAGRKAAAEKGTEEERIGEESRKGCVRSSSSDGGASLPGNQQQRHKQQSFLYRRLLASPLYESSSSRLPPHSFQQPQQHMDCDADGGGLQFEVTSGNADADDDDDDVVTIQHEVERVAFSTELEHEESLRDLWCQEQQKHNSQVEACASLLSVSSDFACMRRNDVNGLSLRDDWTESATRILLEAWGRIFIQLNRGLLKAHHWAGIAETVNKNSNSVRTETQCKNRIDTLKKKYKLEKQKQLATGILGSKWLLYNQIDQLLNTGARCTGLPGAVDAGEMVKDWLPSKGEELRYIDEDEEHRTDQESSSTFGSRDDLDATISSFRAGVVHSNSKRGVKKPRVTKNSFKILANALRKFIETYEKMEMVKRQQLSELEKMRMEFARDLELHRMQLYLQTQRELARLKRCNDHIDARRQNT